MAESNETQIPTLGGIGNLTPEEIDAVVGEVVRRYPYIETLGAYVVDYKRLRNIQSGNLAQSIQTWNHNLTFTAVDSDTVTWGSGTITFDNGAQFSIIAGTTGNMLARTYLYLDTNVSSTTLQTTTDATVASGKGKTLIAVVEAGSALLITTDDLTDLLITADKIAAGAVEEAKIAASAVTAAKTAVAAIDPTTGNITANHIITNMIQAGQITTTLVAADAITAPLINVVGLNGTTGRIVVVDATDANTVTAGVNTYATTLIQAGKILISGATTLANWSAGADATLIDGGDIYTGSITATQIATNAITADKILAGAVTATKINVTNLSSIKADLGSVTAGTITGNLIRTSTGTSRVELKDSTDSVDFYASGALQGSLKGGLVGGIKATNSIFTDTRGEGFGAYNTSGDYFLFYVSGTGVGVIAMPTTNAIIIQNASGGTEYTITSGTLTLNGVNMDASNHYISNLTKITGQGEYLDFSLAGRVQVSNSFDPGTAGTYSLGGDTRYWYYVYYKNLVDKGCLFWADGGVELRDGAVVSDMEALRMIKKHPTNISDKGIPALDYRTMPKAVFHPATMEGTNEEYPRDLENDVPLPYTDGEGVYHELTDGAELSALVSIMLGAIKELDIRLAKVESTPQ